MGKVILYMQLSLDGVVSDPDQWMTLSDEILDDTIAYYDTLDAIIVGGNSYASLAEYWQHAEVNSDSDIEKRFAHKINEIKKVVVSRSPIELTWRNSEQVTAQDTTSLVHEIKKLKERSENDLSVESGTQIWQLFLANDLYDELSICIHPVIAVKGDKLFDKLPTKQQLALVASKTYKNGVISLRYRKALI